MMNFVDKVISNIPDRIVGIVIYENNTFYVTIKEQNYPIYNANCLIGAKKVYSLPINDYHMPWTERIITKPHLLLDEKRRTGIQFWAKYKPKMKITGELINNVFYDKSYSNTYLKKSQC